MSPHADGVPGGRVSMMQHPDFWVVPSIGPDGAASSPVAGVVLLVNALDGVVPAVKESLARAREASASRLVVALTKCDAIADAELLDLVELEVRELLDGFEYAREGARIVRISAVGVMHGHHRRGESLPQLVAALDSWS